MLFIYLRTFEHAKKVGVYFITSPRKSALTCTTQMWIRARVFGRVYESLYDAHKVLGRKGHGHWVFT